MMTIARPAVLTAALIVSGGQATAAQAPRVHSFQELRVKPGQRVIVEPEDGKTIHGRVISVVGNQLEIEQRRWPSTERRVFAEPSVRRIDLRDSTVNGTVNGAIVGALGAVVVVNSCDSEPCFYTFVLSIALGPVLGSAIDAAINRTIYTSKQGLDVTVSPLLGPHRFGLSARIHLPAVRARREDARAQVVRP